MIKVVKDIKDIPEDAVQMHLYDWKNALMPRGSRQKESIYEVIYPRVVEVFESFTDPQYGDNPNPYELLNIMHINLNGEMNNAWSDFMKQAIIEKKSDKY